MAVVLSAQPSGNPVVESRGSLTHCLMRNRLWKRPRKSRQGTSTEEGNPSCAAMRKMGSRGRALKALTMSVENPQSSCPP